MWSWMTNWPVKRQKGTKIILKQIKMEAKQANLWDTTSLNKTEMVGTYRKKRYGSNRNLGVQLKLKISIN